MMDRFDKEADKWIEDYRREEHKSLNIGTKKELVRWCYRRHLFILTECRKQMSELRNNLKKSIKK